MSDNVVIMHSSNLRMSRDLLLTCSVYLYVCLSVCLSVCMFVCLSGRSSLHLVRFGQILRCVDKGIVIILKVCIERNIIQYE